jgi:hypothetical protein
MGLGGFLKGAAKVAGAALGGGMVGKALSAAGNLGSGDAKATAATSPIQMSSEDTLSRKVGTGPYNTLTAQTQEVGRRPLTSERPGMKRKFTVSRSMSRGR